MILEVKHLRMVLAVARHASVTRACRDLHLSQPAVSQQLLLLERRLGTPLFHRVGKRMIPTAAGHRVLATARGVMTDLQQVEGDVRRLAAGQEVLLRLGTQCYTVFHWLPAALATYAKRCPTVDVEIVGSATHAPERALLDGRIDLGILNRPGNDPRLRYVPLFDDEMVAVVAPEHPLAARTFVAPEDLGDEHFITYATPAGRGLVWQAVLGPAGVRPRRVTEVQWTEAIIEFVTAGMGVSVLARWAVERHVRAGQLRAIRFTEHGFHCHWSAALLRSTTTVPPYVAGLIEILGRGPTTPGRARRRRATSANEALSGG